MTPWCVLAMHEVFKRGLKMPNFNLWRNLSPRKLLKRSLKFVSLKVYEPWFWLTSNSLLTFKLEYKTYVCMFIKARSYVVVDGHRTDLTRLCIRHINKMHSLTTPEHFWTLLAWLALAWLTCHVTRKRKTGSCFHV